MTTTTYSTEVLADSPYLYWKLDETSGTTAVDSSGNSRNGTYTNGPTLNQTALINEGKSVDFDGSNDHVKYTLPSNFTGNFTIECWVNNDDFSNYPGLFGAWTANSNGNYGTNVGLNTNGTFDINVARSNFNFWEVNAGGYGSVSTGTRYHIVLTIDDTNDLVKFYINGSQSGSSLTLSNAVGLGASGKELRVASAGAIGGFWNGKVQGFAVYTTVLSASRITAHYNAGVNKEINPTKTNIDVDAKDADFSLVSNPTINQIKTNVNIQSHLPTVKVDELNTSELTNVSISGQDATVLIVQNITVQSSENNISIEAFNPILQVQSGVQIPANNTNILIKNTNSTVVINETISVTSTNITLDAKDALPLYPSLVLSKNPIHYYRFLNQTVNNIILDYGSIVMAGTCYNLNPLNDCVDGIPGDPDSKAIELDSIASSSVQAITFFGQNIWNTNNLLSLNGSYEFWIKTYSENYAIFSMDGTDGNNNKRTAYIGIVDGELAFRYSITDSPESWGQTKSGTYISDGEWHHVVLTQSYNLSTQTQTFRSYVDTERTPVIISLGTFLTFNSGSYGNRRMIGSYGFDQSPFVAAPFTSSVALDEIAFYNFTLNEDQIYDHYAAGTGMYDVEIEPEVADIYVEGIASGSSSQIFVNSASINIQFNGFIVNPGTGSILSFPKFAVIKINKTNSTVENTGGINIFQQIARINLKAGKTRFRTKAAKFKFISSQDLALSSLDAEELESIDYGGLLFNQSKKMLFRIGNEDFVTASYQISVTSKEEGVPIAVTLSKDNITYSPSITVEGIAPNTITDTIYAKLDVNSLDVLGYGTFLINVEQL